MTIIKDIKLCVHESLADFAANRDLKGWVSADEVVDTKPLFEEIKKLSEENRSLKETLGTMEKRAAAVATSQVDKKAEAYKELRKVLRAIEIKVSASLADGKEVKLDLLRLFYVSKDTLINGVTNAAGASQTEIFFYHNVCPKLQVHGLIVNEKVPGARYRRSCVSSLGSAFLADMERRILLEDKAPVVRENGSEKGAPKVPTKRVKRTKAKASPSDET